MTPDSYLVVTDRNWQPVGELLVEPDEVSWVRNGFGEMMFTLSPTSVGFPLVWGQELKREVQFWVLGDDHPLWWGILTDAQVTDSGTARFTVHEVPWYLDSRHVGDANRNNLAMNGSMETAFAGSDPLAGWVASGVEMTRINTHKVDGLWAMNLRQATDKTDTYAHQFIPLPAGDVQVTVAGWVHIRSDSEYPFEEALHGYGVVGHIVAPGLQFQHKAGYGISPRFGHKVGNSYDATFQINTGTQFEAGGHLHLRLYAPRGDTVYDGIQVVLMESMSLLRTDPATVLQRLLEHAQDPDYGRDGVGLTYAGSPTGQAVDFVAQHADHGNILELMAGLGEVDGGLDWRFDYTKELRELVTMYPRFQVVPEEVFHFQEGEGGNIKAFTYERRGRQVRTAIIGLGPGDGPARREGYARNTAEYDGLVLEEIVDMTNSAISDLDGRATNELNKRRKATKVIGLEVPGMVKGRVHPGNAVPVRIRYGGINLNQTLIINEIRYDPKTKTSTLVFNDAQ